MAVTLAYVDDVIGVAADWEPKYGPISVWHRCAAGDFRYIFAELEAWAHR